MEVVDAVAFLAPDEYWHLADASVAPDDTQGWTLCGRWMLAHFTGGVICFSPFPRLRGFLIPRAAWCGHCRGVY